MSTWWTMPSLLRTSTRFSLSQTRQTSHQLWILHNSSYELSQLPSRPPSKKLAPLIYPMIRYCLCQLRPRFSQECLYTWWDNSSRRSTTTFCSYFEPLASQWWTFTCLGSILWASNFLDSGWLSSIDLSVRSYPKKRPFLFLWSKQQAFR